MTQHIAPWALSQILELDRFCLGFCGEVFRMQSAERRQVIAAYLSAKPPTDEDMQEVGQFLLAADHRSILTKAYGEPTEGLRGALRRAGPVVHEERFYTLLHQLLSNPPHAHIVKTISRLRALDLNKLLILQTLPECIARANVVEVLERVRDAKDVATAFRLLVSREVDEEVLPEAIRKVRSGKELTKVWQTWVLKARLPEHPIAGSNEYQGAQTGADLHHWALRYRNCLRRYTSRALDQHSGDYFAEMVVEGRGAIVHLRREREELCLEGAFGPRNSRPDSRLRTRIHEYLSQHGVKVRDQDLPRGSNWDCVERLVSAPFFEFELG